MTEQKQALFTIFGATGDLAKRNLYPSLFRLFKKGELADNFAALVPLAVHGQTNIIVKLF